MIIKVGRRTGIIFFFVVILVLLQDTTQDAVQSGREFGTGTTIIRRQGHGHVVFRFLWLFWRTNDWIIMVVGGVWESP